VFLFFGELSFSSDPKPNIVGGDGLYKIKAKNRGDFKALERLEASDAAWTAAHERDEEKAQAAIEAAYDAFDTVVDSVEPGHHICPENSSDVAVLKSKKLLRDASEKRVADFAAMNEQRNADLDAADAAYQAACAEFVASQEEKAEQP
jgi:hypothetical protein